MEQLHQATNSLKLLRTNVGQIFETLYNGEEHGENKFLQELQDLLTSTNSHLRLVINIITFVVNFNFHYFIKFSHHLERKGIWNRR